MNKKLIVLAVASALAGGLSSAHAADNVTIYGTLNINIENFKSDSASAVGAIPGNSFVTARAAT